MPKLHPTEWDDFDALDAASPVPIRKPAPRRATPPAAPTVLNALAADATDEAGFRFSYRASRHEARWLDASLGGFARERWIADVLRLLKGGKEASVYLCAAPPQLGVALLAAKVYRPRRFRQMKDDSIYRQGRAHLDADGRSIIEDGLLHAIAKRTDFGRDLMQVSWIEHEFQTLKRLEAAGVAVPTPYASGHNAILMGYIGDRDGPAHTLNEVRLPRREAGPLFEFVIDNLRRMLAVGRIHGDLSAYNLLYWEGALTLIDFPQAVDPARNPDARFMFGRDVQRICDYFQRQGVRADAAALAAQLWGEAGLEEPQPPPPEEDLSA
jgi:RIO kinase 1